MSRIIFVCIFSVIASISLCSCYEFTSAIETNSHLDGSADEKLERYLGHVWLAPNIVDRGSGVFVIPGSGKNGLVLAVCIVTPDDSSKISRCLKSDLKAQVIDEGLYVSFQDGIKSFFVFRLQTFESNDKVVFSGVFPYLNQVDISELKRMIRENDKPKYAFGSQLELKRSSVKVSRELAAAVSDLRNIPAGKARIHQWARDNFEKVASLLPEKDDVIKTVNKFDKDAKDQFRKETAKFASMPISDLALEEKVQNILGRKRYTEEKVFFKAGDKIYFAVEQAESVIIKHVKLSEKGGIEILPLTPALRAEDFDTASMDADEIIEFLKEHQRNRSFFDERHSEQVKGFAKQQ